jgi:hypothetical protein
MTSHAPASSRTESFCRNGSPEILMIRRCAPRATGAIPPLLRPCVCARVSDNLACSVVFLQVSQAYWYATFQPRGQADPVSIFTPPTTFINTLGTRMEKKWNAANQTSAECACPGRTGSILPSASVEETSGWCSTDTPRVLQGALPPSLCPLWGFKFWVITWPHVHFRAVLECQYPYPSGRFQSGNSHRRRFPLSSKFHNGWIKKRQDRITEYAPPESNGDISNQVMVNRFSMHIIRRYPPVLQALDHPFYRPLIFAQLSGLNSVGAARFVFRFLRLLVRVCKRNGYRGLCDNLERIGVTECNTSRREYDIYSGSNAGTFI